jgi:nucleoside-diphosphate-sugar epimerase
VIPSVILQIANKKEAVEVGDISTTRDFNYVEDTCRGLILLAENDSFPGEIYNIGSGNEVSIDETINLIKTLMHSNIEIISTKARLRPQNSEVRRLMCDNSKLVNLCGYQASFTLEEGIKTTIDWYCDSGNLSKFSGSGYII